MAAPWQRPRRGATLVLLAIALTVFLGLAALAVDYSRMASFKADLKTATDAIALSAALDQTTAASAVSATTTGLYAANTVEKTALTASNFSVSPVTWNIASPPALGASPPNATWSTANAMQVIGTYTANWTLARIFKSATKVLMDTSVAYVGSRTTHPCLRPIAVPYKALLNQISKGNSAMSYALTADDVYALRTEANKASPITLQYTEGSTMTTTYSGSSPTFSWVDPVDGSSGTASQVPTALTSCISTWNGSTDMGSESTVHLSDNNIKSAMQGICGTSAGNCTTTNPVILVHVYNGGGNSGSTGQVNCSSGYDYNPWSNTIQVPTCTSGGYTNWTATTTTTCVSDNDATYPPTTKNPKKSKCDKNYTLNTLGHYWKSGIATATTFTTAYIAPFRLTAVDATNLKFSGYFTTLNYSPADAGNSWSSDPGPLTSVVLVK